ncbi:hypothetical protein NUW54_g6953 [Trametes sanguinea]|uniref:Uncharacterized protein n=1 Tax=Trametes sanguinea TaxID=158606 RepID=A0ACC1PSS5_9APHY|nr:hypothetical protein NUW54_g6953 [Trametes sanguinea]
MLTTNTPYCLAPDIAHGARKCTLLEARDTGVMLMNAVVSGAHSLLSPPAAYLDMRLQMSLMTAAPVYQANLFHSGLPLEGAFLCAPEYSG